MDRFVNKALNVAQTLLSDPTEEDARLISDRMGGAVTLNASMSQQAVVNPNTSVNAVGNMDDQFAAVNLKHEASFVNPMKLVQLKTAEWNANQQQFAEVVYVSCPRDFYPNTSYPARGVTRYFGQIRAGYHFTINVSAAAGVAGSLVAVWLPKDSRFDLRDKASIFMSAHTIINLATNTSGELMIPYISTNSYVPTDSADSGDLLIAVLSPITAPTGVSPNVTVTIFGSLVDLDLQSPRAQGRDKIDIAEGPGSMNLSFVEDTREAQDIALEGEEAEVDCSTAGATRPVESVKELISTPVIVSSVEGAPSLNVWDVNAAPGTVIYGRNFYMDMTVLSKMLSGMFRLWRGDIVFRFVFVATPFNKGRLRIAFFPNTTSTFTSDQANNAYYTVFELGLNSTATLKIPYTYRKWLRSTVVDGSDADTCIGRMQVFVMNRLQANVNAPSSVRFYITAEFAENAEFSVPIDRGILSQGDPEFVEASGEAAAAAGVATLENAGGAPNAPPEAPRVVLEKVKKISPIKSDHMQLSNLLSRAFYIGRVNFAGPNALNLVALGPPGTGHGSIIRLFYLFSGKFTIHVRVVSKSSTIIAHSYDELNGVLPTGMASLGAVVVPPNSNFSLKIPFYSAQPVRQIPHAAIDAQRVFGWLLSNNATLHSATEDSYMDVWLSVQNAKLFYPLPVPLLVTPTQTQYTRNVIEFQGPPEDQPDWAFKFQTKIQGPGNVSAEVSLEAEGGNGPKGIEPVFKVKMPTKEDLEKFDRRGSGSETLLREGVESNPGPFTTPEGMRALPSCYLASKVFIHYHEDDITRLGVSVNKYGPVLECVRTTAGIDEWTFCENTSWRVMCRVDSGEAFGEVQDYYRENAIWVENDPWTIDEVRKKTSAVQAADMWFVAYVLRYHQFEELREGWKASLLLKEGIEPNPGPPVLSKFFPEAPKMKVVRNNRGRLAVALANGPYVMFRGFSMFVIPEGEMDEFGDEEELDLTNVLDGDSFIDMCMFAFADKFADNLFYTATESCVLAMMFHGIQNVKQAPPMVHFANIAVAISEHFKPIQDLLVKIGWSCISLLMRGLVRCILYGVIFFQNPTISQWILVTTLVGMDVMSMKDISETLMSMMAALLSGKPKDVFEIFINFLYVNCDKNVGSMIKDKIKNSLSIGKTWRDYMGIESQGFTDYLRDFNITTMAAKSITWWMEQAMEIIERLRRFFDPTPKEECMKCLTEGKMEIANQLADIDGYIVSTSNEKWEQTFKDQNIQKEFQDFLVNLKVVADTAEVPQLSNRVSRLSEKLGNLLKKPVVSTSISRTEPIGIWINGPPGQGKSFFVTALAALVAGQLKLKKPGVYFQNAADEFMSGYKGQKFHIIDDFLQHRDEKDLTSIVQAISTVPFRVNMASLEEKGRSYTSEFVMVTTNRTDFLTNSLTSSGALERRFPYQVEIKACAPYVAEGGKLDVSKAMNDGALTSGACWQVTDRKYQSMGQFDMGKLVDAIVEKYTSRTAVAAIWENKLGEIFSQGLDDEDLRYVDAIKFVRGDPGVDDDVFGCLTVAKTVEYPKQNQKIAEWFNETVTKAKKIWDTYKPVFAISAAVITTMTASFVLFFNLPCWKKEEQLEVTPVEPEARAYSGGSSGMPKVVKNTKRIVQKQGYENEFVHLARYLGYLDLGGNTVPFLGLGGKSLLIYSHVLKGGNFRGTLNYSGLSFCLDGVDIEVVNHETGRGPLDLSTITIPSLSFQFKDVSKFVKPAEKQVNKCHLISLASWGMTVGDCSDVRKQGLFEVNDGPQPELRDCGVRYVATTRKGDCGKMLIQKIGSNWYFTAMHVAGDRLCMGYGTEISGVVEEQGVVVGKKPNPTPVFSPSKTHLQPSPLYGIWPIEMQPAPLHPRDKRIVDPPENLVKNGASKYRVNHFDPCPNIFNHVKEFVTRKVLSVVGVQPSMSSFDEAVRGFEGTNPIDLTTSAGTKYVREGLKKKDLILGEGSERHCSARLTRDCEQLLQAIGEGKKGDVTFTATLKDELLKNAKIFEGRTRCIEACNLDYVVVYRKVMGHIYNSIYTSSPVATGVAVGINPFLQFSDIYSSLSGEILAIDYSKYDGSLSSELMAHAVDILASCHEDPKLVENLHKPVIDSIHWVSDEIWDVHGGMPSGSPCTSVLNSLCNLLVCYSALYAAGVHDLEQVTIVTYGDDVLLSVGDSVVDSSVIPQYIGEWFGMEATSADKKSTNLAVSRQEMTFLKRSFRTFPGTNFVTGVLDLTSMCQKIMWCRGFDEFVSQFDSFLDELVLHGPETYGKIKERCRARVGQYGVFFPSYDVRYSIVFNRMFS